MKVHISSIWLRDPWTMNVWDEAYDWLVAAGAGTERAVKAIADIKLAARAGHPQAVRVKQHFDAVALLVAKGLPRPSAFVAQRRRRSPLLPGGAARPTGAQAALVRKQAEEIKRLKAAQIERAKHERLHRQAQAKVAAVKAEAEVEVARIEDQLAAVQKVLEQRTIDDAMRKQLEAQAEQYEAQIEALKRPAGEAAGKGALTEATVAEAQEAQQDDSAAAYPSAAPGDTEFNDAGF